MIPDLAASFEISASGMEAQARRIRHVSENIANADTPGYRRKLALMEASSRFSTDLASVELGPVVLDPSPLAQIRAPGHPLADETGHYAGSNVDLVIEVADARQAQRSYEANLGMFDQSRKMAASLLDLLRR